jgi:hypothetical protein
LISDIRSTSFLEPSLRKALLRKNAIANKMKRTAATAIFMGDFDLNILDFFILCPDA